jgi:hypothetical protein
LLFIYFDYRAWRVTDSFKSCTIISIPKKLGVNALSSANYRSGNALSPVFGKILDNFVLHRYRDTFLSSNLQLVFKTKYFTHDCTMILKETISFYVNNDSSAFSTILDASKAFDRVHYCKMFKLLIKRELSAVIIRVLANLHKKGDFCTRQLVWHSF